MTVVSRASRFTGVTLLAALMAACASRSTPRVLPPVSSPGVEVARTATTLLGAPYRDGGRDPSGFDCSGFVHYVFAQRGVTTPRDVRGLWTWGVVVTADEIAAGDLLFFATSGNGPSHVTIAIDHDRFVHAPSSRGVVRVESRSSPYWAKRFLGARRPVAGA